MSTNPDAGPDRLTPYREAILTWRAVVRAHQAQSRKALADGTVTPAMIAAAQRHLRAIDHLMAGFEATVIALGGEKSPHHAELVRMGAAFQALRLDLDQVLAGLLAA